MASNKIGSLQFNFLSWGAPDQRGEKVEVHSRYGVDGVSTRKIGSKSQQSELLSSVDVSSAAAVKSVYQSYKALEGTNVTVTDAFGNTWANVKILAVELVRAKTITSGVGGQNATPVAILECRWTVMQL